MSENLSKIKRRYHALRVLASSAKGTPEGDTAQERVDRLAKKYGFTKADDPRPTAGIIVEVFETASNAIWRATLAWRLMPYTSTHVVREKTGNIRVYGTKTDIDLFKSLFRRAELEIDIAGTSYMSIPVTHGGGQGAGKGAGAAFRKGAAIGFATRLMEYKDAANASEQGTITASLIGTENKNQLVLVSKELALKEHVSQFKFGTFKESARGDKRAANAGYKYGKGMSVHLGSIEED